MELERERGGIVGQELKAVSNADRTIKGYASIFGAIDSYGDVVRAGAFSRTLKERTPMMLWQHNPLEPVGVWDLLREDSRGLYVEGRLADTTRGRDAFELFRMGAIKGLSIGFAVRDSKPNKSSKRDLLDVTLWEISPVSFAACPQAEVDQVKMQNRLEASVERLCKALDGLRVPATSAPNAPEASMAWRIAMTEQQHALQQPHGRW